MKKLIIEKLKILEEAQRPKGSIFRKTPGVENNYRTSLAKSIVQERKKAQSFRQQSKDYDYKNPSIWRDSPKDLLNKAETHKKRAQVISATNSLHIPKSEFYKKIGKINKNPDGTKYTTSKGGISHWNDVSNDQRQNWYQMNKENKFNPKFGVYHQKNPEAVRERINTGVENKNLYINKPQNVSLTPPKQSSYGTVY